MEDERELTLYPSLPRKLFLLVVTAAFTVIGVLMIRTHESRGWFVAIVFGLGLAIAVLNALPQASFLRLTPEGFVVSSLFRRRPFYRWDSVSEFQVIRVPPVRTKLVGYETYSRESAWISSVNRGLVGVNSALPDTYGRKAESLAGLMNQWRNRALPRGSRGT